MSGAPIGPRRAPAPLGRKRTKGPGLSKAERVIAARIASGAMDKVIAAELGLTVKTVKTHVGNALRKLDVAAPRRVHLALFHLGRCSAAERDALLATIRIKPHGEGM